MSIKVNLGKWNSIFAIPNCVVDEGLKYCDGVKLKVLLYLLRHSGEDISIEDISLVTGVNKTDIPETIEYWVQNEILSNNDNILEPNKNENNINAVNTKKTECVATNTVTENAEPKKIEKPKFVASRPQKPDYVYTTQRLAADKELAYIVSETGVVIGKALSNSDIATILMLKDTCGLPIEVLLMLVQYCVSIDKGNISTIEKIGIKWANDGINSVESAENKIRLSKQISDNFNLVSKVFGLANLGSPTKKQLEYAGKWVGEWKYSTEMLREAYERCVDTKGELNFRYIDGIIKRWNSSNIHNLEQLHNFEKSSAKPKNKKPSSFNVDALEKIDILENI